MQHYSVARISHEGVGEREKSFIFSFMIFLIPPLLMFPMELWTYRSFRGTGDYAEAIFKAFGFPNTKRIDLRHVGSMNFEPSGWKQAWRADLMLQKLTGN